MLVALELYDLLPQLRKILPIFIETNGTLVDQFMMIKCWIDYVSMDIKLPSVTGMPAIWNIHRDFLEATRGIETFVKVVVGSETSDEEIMLTAQLIAETKRSIPLIIQPITVSQNDSNGVSPVRLLSMHQCAATLLNDVRIIPQTHRQIELP